METHEKFLVALIAVAALAALAAPHWLPAVATQPRTRHATVPAPDDGIAPATLPRPPSPPFDPATFARQLQTAHYAIASNATPEQSRRMADELEALHAAYAGFFAGRLPPRAPGARFRIALYRDRADFHAHNVARGWAHGLYRAGVCHAYFDAQAASPTQWMLHEATHQLDTEWADFARTPWVEEALASYFGTSVIDDGVLQPGTPDPRTYPLRWVGRLALSGDRERDLARRRIVPLRELIESDGPQRRYDVNPYYLGYWSLGHYLMHGDGGRHAAAFRAMIEQGGTLERFERLVGPVDRVEADWYAYLLAQRDALREGAYDGAVAGAR